MIELASRIEERILTRRLIRRGEPLLVAVSGGVDSMVLLDLLHGLSSAHEWKLTIAHFNHQLRARSSDADEKLVRAIARRYKIPIVVGRADVRRLAKAEKLSIEMAARQARHKFLASTAARMKICKIVLAHHADDQIELFFLRLLRGTGTESLGGMRWSNPSPTDPAVQLVRPLLDQPKSALTDYAADFKIAYRDDATNHRLDFQRNRIRNELLPLLRRHYQPTLDRSILRLSDFIRSDAEFVTQSAKRWLKDGMLFTRKCSFDQLPLSVQRRCLFLQLADLAITPNHDLIEQLRLRAETPVTVAGADSDGQSGAKFLVRNVSGSLQLKANTCAEFQSQSLELLLKKSGKAQFGAAHPIQVNWRIKPASPSRIISYEDCVEYFDADKVGPHVTLRHWQPGDRFQPIGMLHPVKLQDFFVNRKVPREQRHHLILGVTAKSEVFWIESMRISEKFKLTDKTIRCLQWAWKRL